MRRWTRRLVAVCAVLIWLGGSVMAGGEAALAGGAQGGAAAAGVAASGEKSSELTLEQAIGVAKQFIQVPDDYKNFQPNYNNTAGLTFWDLFWNSDNPNAGSITARVNTATGELWGMQRWQPPPAGNTGRGLPKLSRPEAQSKAAAFLSQVLPRYSGSLTVDPDAISDPYLGFRDMGSSTYSFNFVRMVNGIPFTENSANIQVDARTGAVDGFSFNWDNTIVFPEAQGLLTSGQADSLWRNNARVQLAYFTPRVDGKGPATARLLYAPKTSSLMIDAKSGEILKPGENPYDYLQLGMGGAGADGYMRQAAKSVPLTPAEQAALTELGKLISQDRALETVRSLIEIPTGFVLQSSSLQQEYMTGDRVWSFYWRDPEGRKSLVAQVDAGQGRLVEYNMWVPEPDQPGEPRLGEAEARDLATRFLSAAAGDCLAQMEGLRRVPTTPIRPLAAKQPAPKPTSFSFTANRLVNGVPFIGNGVTLTVDAVGGKVTNYMLNWWETKFPETRGAIARELAEDVFLANGALALSYRREYGPPDQLPGQLPPVRLVYALTQKAPSYVDAFTGQGLGGDFQPRMNADQQAFTDLAGAPGAAAISALARARIIPVYESAFHPEAPLSRRDWLIWLVRASGWQSTPAADPDQEYKNDYQQAIQLGILKQGEQYQPEGALDRVTMARMVVRALGWDEIAGFKGIWSLPPAPPGGAGKVAAADQGYLSLAAGLGIFDLNDRDFDPASGLTRAEGALAIYKILN